MKKLLLIPALMLGTAVMAKQMAWEISPMIGYNVAEGNLGMKDSGYLTGGAEIQYNNPDWAVSPELSGFYSEPEYVNGTDTKVARVMMNLVKTFGEGTVVPFAKIGAGFEKMGAKYDGNVDGLFVDAGAGLKVPFTDNIALKLEAIYMAKRNDGRYDNNVIALAGLTFAFGEIKEEVAPAPVVAAVAVVDGDADNDGVKDSVDNCPSTPAGSTVDAKGCIVDGDDDNDGVLNSVDACLATVAGVAVDAKGCMIDGDDDNDGVKNSMDKCPSTKANHAVDANGCVSEIDLNINFKTGSSEVDSASKANITKFASFMKAAPSYKAEIIGYTDSVGRASSNKRLSLKRANIVKGLISAEGVPSNRLSATGMGEANPVADNKTKAGRAQNRRIEAKLSH